MGNIGRAPRPLDGSRPGAACDATAAVRYAVPTGFADLRRAYLQLLRSTRYSDLRSPRGGVGLTLIRLLSAHASRVVRSQAVAHHRDPPAQFLAPPALRRHRRLRTTLGEWGTPDRRVSDVRTSSSQEGPLEVGRGDVTPMKRSMRSRYEEKSGNSDRCRVISGMLAEAHS